MPELAALPASILKRVQNDVGKLPQLPQVITIHHHCIILFLLLLVLVLLLGLSGAIWGYQRHCNNRCSQYIYTTIIKIPRSGYILKIYKLKIIEKLQISV